MTGTIHVLLLTVKVVDIATAIVHFTSANILYKKQPIKHLSLQGIHGRMNWSPIYKFKIKPEVRIRFWPKRMPGPRLYTSNRGRFLKFRLMNILENLKPLLFYFHTFGVRRSIDILGSANQPGSGSGTLGPTEDV